MTAEAHQWKEYFAPIYKWRLLLDFWLNDGFSPQEASVATLCRVLPLVSGFKWLVLNNGPLEFTFFILFQVTSHKQRTTWVYLFILFQAVSPKQRTAWVYLFLSCLKLPVLNNKPLEFTCLSCFKSPVLNNGPLEFTFFYLFWSCQS